MNNSINNFCRFWDNNCIGENMKKWLKITIITGLVALILCSLFVAIFINNIMGTNNVKFDKEKLIAANQEICVFDDYNKELENNITSKNIVNVADLSNNTINAFISIEDKAFFKHKGLNYKRIAKAMINNLKAGSFKEGASTISQQLIKNTHLSSEKTITRKIKEMLLTKKLEKQFSKKDILESYLNVIYFGENSYGIEKASQTYFGKSATELNLSESATLAGVIKSPYAYSPVYNKEKCLERRNLVLSEMLKDKKITQAQYDDAVNSPLEIVAQNKENKNSLYINACLNEAQELLNLNEKELRTSGIKIYSYFDKNKQDLLYDIANNESNYHVNSYGNTNDSLLILLSNKTKGVVAYSGKSDYSLVNFSRQPGSAIKPTLVYAPALENGIISPKTLILDQEIDFDGYSPKNVGGTYKGYVSVEESLCDSLNIPAVKTLNYVGIDNAKNFAKNFGIKFDETDNGLAIALGGFTNGVNLKDLTNSYLAFANNGKYSKCNFIKKIIDKNGKTIYEHEVNEQNVIGDDTAYLMTDMLKKACKKGTSRKLANLNFDVAGKTGTVAIKGTNNNTDAYSIAYTTEHTMGVWIGNYTNKPEFVLEGKNNGGTYATNMIKLCFEDIYKTNKPKNFEKPNSVAEKEIDLMEYENNHVIKLASANCPDRYKFKALFSKRYLPTVKSELFENLVVENFDVKLDQENAVITFNAKDYFKYEICRVNNGITKTLKTISNKNDKITYYDVNLKPSSKYAYYIKISTIDDNTNATSETLTILTNKQETKFDKMLKKDDGLSWLFG